MTTHVNYTIPEAISATAASKDELIQFMSVWPDIMRDLTEFAKKRDIGDTAMKWFSKALQYNVPNGKKNRGLATVVAYKMLSDDVSEENIRLAQILGWCVEMVSNFFGHQLN